MRYLIVLFYLLSTLPASATLNEVDKTQIFSKNMLVNGGFESGKAKWTPNDTADFAVTGSSPMIGLYHATWDADADTDTLVSTAIAVPAGFFTRNGVASCVFTTASGTATVEIQAYDGSNILSEASITSSTSPTRTSTNFIFPSSGNIQLRLYANADEPSVAIDDCYLGPAEGYNVSSVSQATFVGGMENAGSGATCNYSQNTSSGFSDFIDLGTGTSCAAWTVVSNGPGTISAQATNDHRLVYTNMPPGNYQFVLSGVMGNASAANASFFFRLSDGTTTYQPQGAGVTAQALNVGLLVFHVSVTTAGTRTYKIQSADNAAITTTIFNSANNPVSWKIYRFPTSSEQAYTPDLQAMSWSGYHTSTCDWTFTGALADITGDATCSLTAIKNQNMSVSTSLDGSNARPGIKIVAGLVGIVFDVCAVIGHDNTNVGQVNLLQLTDGTDSFYTEAQAPVAAYQMSTTICGQFTSVSAATAMDIRIKGGTTANTGSIDGTNQAIAWTVKSLHRPIPQPGITNMVTTSSSGGIKINTAEIDCDSGATLPSNPGSWVSTIGNVSGGACVLTLVSGTYSSAPHCFLSLKSAALGETYSSSVSVTSATSVTVMARAAAGASTAWTGYVTCIGAR